MRSGVGIAVLVMASACANEPASAPPETAAAAHNKEAPSRGACGDILVYGANADRTQFVVIDVDAKMHGLRTPGSKKTFDLTKAPEGLTVWLDVYLEPAVGQIHCTGTRTERQMAERYQAAKGTLTIERTEPNVVTARLEGARFVLEGRPSIDVGSKSFDHVRIDRAPSGS